VLLELMQNISGPAGASLPPSPLPPPPPPAPFPPFSFFFLPLSSPLPLSVLSQTPDAAQVRWTLNDQQSPRNGSFNKNSD